MGVQLQCAQCHNHPFTEWKQTEYWGMAAFFTKVQTTRPQAAARQGASPTVEESDRPRRGRAGLPESAKIVPPTSQNQPRIEQDLLAYLPGILDRDDAEVTRRCEHLVRNYDPCISCATHFLKVCIDRKEPGNGRAND